jgi:hypothetical protein
MNRSLVPCAPPWRLPDACPSIRQHAQRTMLYLPESMSLMARMLSAPVSSVAPAGGRVAAR